MSEVNPYQSPEADPHAVDAGSFSPRERTFAARLLRIHERGHYSLGQCFIDALPRYAGEIGGVSLIWWLSNGNPLDTFRTLFGLVVGIVAVELQHARLLGRSWPLQEKFIDWRRVEAVAEGGPSES